MKVLRGLRAIFYQLPSGSEQTDGSGHPLEEKQSGTERRPCCLYLPSLVRQSCCLDLLVCWRIFRERLVIREYLEMRLLGLVEGEVEVVKVVVEVEDCTRSADRLLVLRKSQVQRLQVVVDCKMFANQPQEPHKCQELQQTAGYMTSAGQLLVPRKSPVRQLQEVGCRTIAKVLQVPRKSPERLRKAKDCKMFGERPLVLRKSPEER